MASQRGESAALAATPVKKRKGLDKSHYLYIAVIVAVVLGALVGLMFPEVGKSLGPAPRRGHWCRTVRRQDPKNRRRSYLQNYAEHSCSTRYLGP